MNLNAFLLLTFNAVLGCIVIKKARAILHDGRHDLIQRDHRVPFANPVLVANQIGYWNMACGIVLFVIAAGILVFSPEAPLRTMLLVDFVALSPFAIWKFFITQKHDAIVGYKPTQELTGSERAFALFDEQLDSGEALQATVISKSVDSLIETHGTVAREDGGIAFRIERKGKPEECITEKHQFSTVSDFSRYLEQHTILRLGDFSTGPKG